MKYRIKKESKATMYRSLPDCVTPAPIVEDSYVPQYRWFGIWFSWVAWQIGCSVRYAFDSENEALLYLYDRIHQRRTTRRIYVRNYKSITREIER